MSGRAVIKVPRPALRRVFKPRKVGGKDAVLIMENHKANSMQVYFRGPTNKNLSVNPLSKRTGKFKPGTCEVTMLVKGSKRPAVRLYVAEKGIEATIGFGRPSDK